MMDASTTPVASSRGFSNAIARFAPLQLCVLVVLFASVGISQASHLAALASFDIWRHLSVGTWILDHHSVPRTLLFSQSSVLPWIDASWLFDALPAAAVKLLGLPGLVFPDMALAFASAVAIFALARGVRCGFWSGAVLTAIALYLLAGLPLRSSLASVVLFALELTLLADIRSAPNSRSLYSLPLLFLLWANLDIQLVWGLVAFGLFLVTEMLAPLAMRSPSTAHNLKGSVRTTAIVTAASVAATLINPYGFRLWGAALRSVSVFAADTYIPEMHSLRFRQPHDYVLLLLVMTAFFALGRRHARDLFSLSLLTLCSIVSFHLQRDAWLVTIAAVAVLSWALDAGASDSAHAADDVSPRWIVPAAAIVALIVLVATFAARVPSSRDALLAKASERFPVRAADFIRENNLPKPLFNPYDWGSFLTWYLPEYPVAIDSRTDAYGEDLTLAYFKLTTAQVPLQDDPGFSRAATILLEAGSEMGKALSTLPGYKQVYLDDHAMVLVREN